MSNTNKLLVTVLLLFIVVLLISCGGSGGGGAFPDADGDGFTSDIDCDDTDASINPEAEEIPDDKIDQDCDGWDSSIFFADNDGDGFGDPDVYIIGISRPEGYVTNNSDCDDNTTYIRPDAEDMPDDGIDQDCDGHDTHTYYADADGDGFGDHAVYQIAILQPEGYVANDFDCDDNDASINPDAQEIPDDGIDNDCDGLKDPIMVPDDYPTIQEAIDAALYGDTILVLDGTYKENIVFSENKEIIVKSKNGVESTIIDGNASGSVVTFSTGEDVFVVLDGFTITNGTGTVKELNHTYGGGIYCESSSPMIKNCVIKGNLVNWSGGGIYFRSSSPTITNCTITGNSADIGGGIKCDSSLPTIEKSTVSDNSAKSGGGIFFDNSIATITNCMITDNSATHYGGGIGYGFSSKHLTIKNCTITGNSADIGGGIFFTYVSLNQHHTITNSIIWINTAEISSDQIYNGADTDIVHSNIQGGWLWGAGNIDEDPLFIDSENGDYRLQEGSPCIDAGTNAGAPDDDIDGNQRPQGFGYDMGAYETVSLIYNDYDIDGYTIDEGDCDDTDTSINPGAEEICGDGIDQDCNGFDIACNSTIYVPSEYATIQEAINVAQEGGVILVYDGTYYENISYLGKEITLSSLNGADSTIIDGNAIGNVVNFNHEESNNASLDGFTITNAGNDKYGLASGIYCNLSSSPTIINCTITGISDHSIWGAYGAGIECRGSSSPIITDCTVTNNLASSGGGISSFESSSPTIDNCTITGNSATFGGGIRCSDYTTITYSTITNNTASYDGGGIFGSPTITYSTIIGNSAGGDGGGISGSPTITDSTITNNSAGNGGAIYSFSSEYEITNSKIAGNSAVGNGGGIYCHSSSPAITNSKITGNSASIDGGGIYCDHSSPTITNSVITDNSADTDGGGMYCYDSSPTITNSMITDNSTNSGGGGIYCINNTSSTIINSTISNNTADFGGGIAVYDSSDPTVVNSIFWGDAATSDGDEVYVEDDPLDPSSINITYSDIQGGWLGNGNIDADPMFVDDTNSDMSLRDYHITAGSPCIDTGTDSYIVDELNVVPAIDIEWDARPQGAGIDIGADEYTE